MVRWEEIALFDDPGVSQSFMLSLNRDGSAYYIYKSVHHLPLFSNSPGRFALFTSAPNRPYRLSSLLHSRQLHLPQSFPSFSFQSLVRHFPRFYIGEPPSAGITCLSRSWTPCWRDWRTCIPRESTISAMPTASQCV